MPVYSAKIVGRNSPIMVRADTAAKARDLLVDVAALTGEEMADAMEAGAIIWKPGQDVPSDITVIDEQTTGLSLNDIINLSTEPGSAPIINGKEVNPKA